MYVILKDTEEPIVGGNVVKDIAELSSKAQAIVHPKRTVIYVPEAELGFRALFLGAVLGQRRITTNLPKATEIRSKLIDDVIIIDDLATIEAAAAAYLVPEVREGTSGKRELLSDDISITQSEEQDLFQRILSRQRKVSEDERPDVAIVTSMPVESREAKGDSDDHS